MLRRFLRTSPLIVALVAGVLCVGALYAAQSYSVTKGGGSLVVNEFGTCKRVTNNNAKDIFVPTKTTNEWSLFRTNAQNVTLGDCVVGLMRTDVFRNDGTNSTYATTSPAGTQYAIIKAYGAGGGGTDRTWGKVSTANGGYGGYVAAQYAISGGESLTIMPGGGGGSGGSGAGNGYGPGGGGMTKVVTSLGTLWAGGGGGAAGNSYSQGPASNQVVVDGDPAVYTGSSAGTWTTAGGGDNGTLGLGGNGKTQSGSPQGNGGWNGGGSGGAHYTQHAGGGGGGGGYYGGSGGNRGYGSNGSGGDITSSPGYGGSSYANGSPTGLTYLPARIPSATSQRLAYDSALNKYFYINSTAVAEGSYTEGGYSSITAPVPPGATKTDIVITVAASYQTQCTRTGCVTVPAVKKNGYSVSDPGAGKVWTFNVPNQDFEAFLPGTGYLENTDYTSHSFGTFNIGFGGSGNQTGGPGAAIIEYYGY